MTIININTDCTPLVYEILCRKVSKKKFKTIYFFFFLSNRHYYIIIGISWEYKLFQDKFISIRMRIIRKYMNSDGCYFLIRRRTHFTMVI